MTGPQAVFSAAVVLAVAGYLAATSTPGEAQKGGPYSLGASNVPGHVWRINTATGAVSSCYGGGAQAVNPTCNAWSQP
jgi:ABC-type phosphate transport system substrate-binding protein